MCCKTPCKCMPFYEGRGGEWHCISASYSSILKAWFCKPSSYLFQFCKPQHVLYQELMSHQRQRRSMKLALPARCHHNPNSSLSTFHIGKWNLVIWSHIWNVRDDTNNNGGEFPWVIGYNWANVNAFSS